MRRRLLEMVVGVGLLTEACGATAPSDIAALASGSWDVVLASTTTGELPARMVLTEASGSVTGTLDVPLTEVTEVLSGSVTSTGNMTLNYLDFRGERGLFVVTINSSGRTFSGTFTITSRVGDQNRGAIRGTKK